MDLDFVRFFSYISPTFDTDIFDDYNFIYNNRWKNQAGTAILKTVISPNIYLKTQVYGSFFSSSNLSMLDFEYFDVDEGDTFKLYYSTNIQNGIQDLSFKSTLSILLSPAHTFTVGGN